MVIRAPKVLYENWGSSFRVFEALPERRRIRKVVEQGVADEGIEWPQLLESRVWNVELLKSDATR